MNQTTALCVYPLLSIFVSLVLEGCRCTWPQSLLQPSAGSGGTYLPINSEPCIPFHLHNGSGFNIWILVKEAFVSDCNTSEQSKVCIANQRLTLDLFRGYEVYIEFGGILGTSIPPDKCPLI